MPCLTAYGYLPRLAILIGKHRILHRIGRVGVRHDVLGLNGVGEQVVVTHMVSFFMPDRRNAVRAGKSVPQMDVKSPHRAKPLLPPQYTARPPYDSPGRMSHAGVDDLGGTAAYAYRRA